ncbi:MAG: hypothetical protein D6798_05875 [Deltaproteobacteria bacterium]|nr:MAG: hypothetical protein D6798_05875 [Deltaproteobacteria bacterium]
MQPLPYFQDRTDAGEQLVERLRPHRDRIDLVLGLSGGGVEVAAPIARALGLPLHIAVIETGGGTLHRLEATSRMRASLRGAGFLDAAPSTADAGHARFEADLAELEARHAAHHDLPPVEDRRVLLVDDGLHPDTQVQAALQALRSAGAASIILATPLMTEASATHHGPACDEIIALHRPDDYGAATEYYVDPTPPTPDRVRALVAELSGQAPT